MRTIAIAVITAAGLALAACSAEDRSEMKEGAEAAGAEIKDAASDIANDPDVKEAGAAVKEAGAEAADMVKDGAAEVQEGLSDSAADDKAEAENDAAAAGDTRR
jgi:hypothetical protein